MNYKTAAEIITSLRNADLALRDKLIENRQLGAGYDQDMQALHNRNAKILEDIIDTIGYPTADKVGKEAGDAAWLVIQHSIGQPAFMQKCAGLLEAAVREHRAAPKELAYLTDRIAVLEGKPQLYGTQFDWDETGTLSPNRCDDPAKVNERRKTIGLNTIEAQTAVIRRQAENEYQLPPADPEKRRREMEAWRKAVGWIK